jgi:hypothetical protein
VKCSLLYKGDGLGLTHYAFYSLEILLNVGLSASVDNMNDWYVGESRGS